MKKLLILISVVFSGIHIHTQNVTMREVFIAMPDSLLPYLSHNNKLDLVDFIESNMNSEITNEFDNKTQIDTLTSDYLRLWSSPASLIEMKLLPYIAVIPTDSVNQILCVVETLGEEPAESVIRFYTPRWTPIQIEDPLQGLADKLIARPDTMPQEHFDILGSMTSPPMIVCTLSADCNCLSVRLSIPMLSTEEKKSVTSLLSQKDLKWNGRKFK